MKLKTRILFMENEMTKNERLVSELMQQDSFQGPSNKMGGLSKLKLETHLTINLKKKIKELQVQNQLKLDEIEVLRKKMKITKITEIEIEMKTYIDECARLRQQLEEVIISKDRFADPEEVKAIENKFNQQDQVIQTMKNENNDLVNAYNAKEDELQQFRALVADMERKVKKSASHAKETSKFKKDAREKNRELKAVKQELNLVK